MPHLLIAGATGSGKSVCVNTIITSLAYRHTPRTLRFLMVDPKMVELSVYNTLPHLRHKVITDNRDAASVLKWAVMEMQERYELLAANGCRNIQDFNKRVQDAVPLKLPKRPDVAFENTEYKGGILPYIVVVIDEMADLMMTVQGEVETPIAMLAQKARAIGIHLILATQRPSVNVITGLIKANFPSRIAFRVASQIDSRTIIDGAGAEMLLGNGDMLFIPPGKSEPSRLQGAYLSSEETERLMQWYQDKRGRQARGARRSGARVRRFLRRRAGYSRGGAGQGSGGGGPGRRRSGRRRRSRQTIPRGSRSRRAEPAGFNLAIAASSQSRLWSCSANHRSTALGRRSRPAGWLQAARRAGRTRSTRPHLWPSLVNVLVVAFACLAARPAPAQSAPPVVDSTAPHRLRVDGALLHPTQLVYQTTLERDSGTTVLGYRTIAVSSSTYAGVPAWLLVETRFGDGIPATDSLFTTFVGLTPMHWSALQGSARLVTEFRADTTFGGTSAPQGRRSIVAALPPGTIVSSAMLETVLRLLPLSIGWEDSTSIISVSVASNSTLPARLAVIGEDRVRVPAGHVRLLGGFRSRRPSARNVLGDEARPHRRALGD